MRSATSASNAAGTGPHWIVYSNYRLRTAFFTMAFVIMAIELWGQPGAGSTLAMLIVPLLAYPHLVCLRARLAADSQQAELNNLVLDSFMIGLCMASLHFPSWLTVTLWLGTSLNIAISRGAAAIIFSVLAFSGGAAVSVALLGWHFDPHMSPIGTAMCVAGMSLFLFVFGISSHARNLKLGHTRATLRAREQLLHATNRDLEGALAALKDAQQQLVLNEKMASIGTLTAGVAHEINNPVNFAHAGAQTLVLSIEQFRATLLALAGDSAEAETELRPLLRRETDELLRQVSVIVEGTTRIRDIVKNLRAFSRLDEAARKTVSLSDTILSTVRLVRMHYAETTEIECLFERDVALECWPAQLNQVFMNLIINACDAIGQRQRSGNTTLPGRLQIQTRIEYDRLLIEFEDNGCGISPDAIGRIFEPFFTTKEVGRGTGLGLAISYGIVRKHGGDLRARSVPGQGSCFTVALPLVPPAQGEGAV